MPQKDKTLSIFLIILLSFAGLAVIGFFCFAVLTARSGFDFHIGFDGTRYIDNLVLEKEFDMNSISLIDITQDYGDIEIIPSATAEDNTKIIVKAYAKDEGKVKVYNEGATLYALNSPDSCNFLCFNQNGVKFLITIPEGYTGNFKIESDYGKTSIGSFKNASIDATSDYGDIEVGSAKNIHLELDAGDARVGNCYGRINIKNDMGNVDIDHLELTENSSIELDMGNVSISDVGTARVITTVDLGNTDVQRHNDESTIILTIQNDMGNVTVR
jgi:hypothetical protein